MAKYSVIAAYMVVFAIQNCHAVHNRRLKLEEGNDLSRIDDRLYFTSQFVQSQHEKALNGPESQKTDSFQGCLLGCLDSDLCCSCKESSKKMMNIALINQLTSSCATSDIGACSRAWLKSSIGSASSCIKQSHVENEMDRCVKRCIGKPLNPKHPSSDEGLLTKLTDQQDFSKLNRTDFCMDIRAGGILCSVFRSDSYTAGNTLCRHGMKCDYHGYSYSWCYVDFSNTWDYCCTGNCRFAGEAYMWCHSGSKWQYCGKGGNRDIYGRPCVNTYPCGMHQERGKANYYWCYVDANRNWGKCCEPWDPCSKKGESHAWCYTGYKKRTGEVKCKKPCITI